MQSTTGNSPVAATALEFLAFKLGQEECGVDTQKVQELLERMLILIDIDKLLSIADAAPTYPTLQ